MVCFSLFTFIIAGTLVAPIKVSSFIQKLARVRHWISNHLLSSLILYWLTCCPIVSRVVCTLATFCSFPNSALTHCPMLHNILVLEHMWTLLQYVTQTFEVSVFSFFKIKICHHNLCHSFWGLFPDISLSVHSVNVI